MAAITRRDREETAEFIRAQINRKRTKMLEDIGVEMEL